MNADPTFQAELLRSFTELLQYCEAERGWEGEADAEVEDWIVRARLVLRDYKRPRRGPISRLMWGKMQ